MSAPERASALLHQVYAFVESHRDLMRAVFGAEHSSEQYERGMQLLQQRVAHSLEQQPFIPTPDVPWLAALLAGLIAGGVRFAVQHPDVTAADMTERTLRLIRPLSDIYTPPESSTVNHQS